MSENFIAELPKKFKRNTLDLCGAAGVQWLKDLPRIIEELSVGWQLKVEKPFPNLSYNLVAPCVGSDGGKAVLKIALPLSNPEIFSEARFLQMAQGNGAVKLFEIDERRRAILLERVMPGANLKEVCPEDATKAVEITIPIMRGLLKQPPRNSFFREIGEWFNNFFEKAPKTTFPLEFQNKAREFYKELTSTSKQKYLIHGDLHHENILSATREPFLAIDPKGIIGNVGYEIAVFLNNHLWWLASDTNLKEKLDDAVRQFSESFEIEQKDLRKWAFAQIALSTWWTFDENGENWERELAFAEFWEV